MLKKLVCMCGILAYIRTMPRSKPHPIVADLADKAFRGGVSIGLALKLADIHPTTWTRWARHGAEPTRRSIERLSLALDILIASSAEGPTPHGTPSRDPEGDPQTSTGGA